MVNILLATGAVSVSMYGSGVRMNYGAQFENSSRGRQNLLSLFYDFDFNGF